MWGVITTISPSEQFIKMPPVIILIVKYQLSLAKKITHIYNSLAHITKEREKLVLSIACK